MDEDMAETLRATRSEPAVESLRQILLWPLGIAPAPASPSATPGCLDWLKAQLATEESTPCAIEMEMREVARVIEEAGNPWVRVADGLGHVHDSGFENSKLSPFPYAEFVYFHDFVSGFLFSKAIRSALDKSTVPAFYLFKHETLSAASVTITHHVGWKETKIRLTQRFDAKVERTNLYLFRTGVALLVIELLFKAPPIFIRAFDAKDKDVTTEHAAAMTKPSLSLDDVLRLSDKVRRAYIPAFDRDDEGGGPWEAFGVPDSVEWAGLSATAKVASVRSFEQISGLALDGDKRAAPLLDYWRALLPDSLVVDGDGRKARSDSPTFRHLVDERMPLMSQVQLAKKKENDRPLDDVQIGRFMRLCFVDSPGTSTYPYSPAFLSPRDFRKAYCYDRFLDDGTRYLISPYSFTAIGSGEYFEKTITHHFRRMYFQMVMLSNFEYASLIAFSSRISRAIEEADRAGKRLNPSFRLTMLQIHEDFLTFVHRFRFTGISNQVQARELHEKVRAALGLEKLFEDVKTEIEMGVSHLRATESAVQTDAAARLNVLLGLVAVFSLAFTGGQLFKEGSWRLPVTTLFLAGFSAALALMVWWLNRNTQRSVLAGLMIKILGVVALFSLGTCVISCIFLSLCKAG